MFIRLFLLFSIIPLLELYVLLQAGRMIGVLPTVALILLTGVAGAYLARTQGFDIISRIRRELTEGRIPGESLLDGAMVLAGGILLLTPGFCTDLLGFLLLVPASRSLLKNVLKRNLHRMSSRGAFRIYRDPPAY